MKTHLTDNYPKTLDDIDLDKFRELLYNDIERRIDRLKAHKTLTPDIVHHIFLGTEHNAPYFAKDALKEIKE